MAKSALDHFCRSYAVLLASKGIRINNVSLESVLMQLVENGVNGNKVVNGASGRVSLFTELSASDLCTKQEPLSLLP